MGILNMALVINDNVASKELGLLSELTQSMLKYINDRGFNPLTPLHFLSAEFSTLLEKIRSCERGTEVNSTCIKELVEEVKFWTKVLVSEM